MSKKTDQVTPTLYDAELVNDFITVQRILGTIEYAQEEAKQTENEMLKKISSYKTDDEVIVNPAHLPVSENDNILRNSFDSQLKKVQSAQLKEHGLSTIRDLQAKNNAKYLNKKVTIKLTDSKYKPFHNHWFNQNTGEDKLSPNKSKSISGKISQINFTENYIVIKPGRFKSLISKALVEQVVEVMSFSDNRSMINILFN